MKITRLSELRHLHCCDCGSEAYEFDEIQHNQYCKGIAIDQRWDKDNCGICLHVYQYSTVSYKCASCDFASDRYEFITFIRNIRSNVNLAIVLNDQRVMQSLLMFHEGSIVRSSSLKKLLLPLHLFANRNPKK